MIIAPQFQGDDGRSLANAQHDVYGDALLILIETCNRFARLARTLLDDTEHNDWGRIDGRDCDHRTLQGAHDLLAAAWRYETSARQRKLPFAETRNDASVQILWLNWLRNELSGWIDYPYLVRSVQVILTNQNNPVGYAAESRLCLDIMDRFPSVPWRSDLRKAYE